MHDTLRFMQKDPVYRRHHHSGLTFGLLYAFSENSILPLSHDEVVLGKGSLIGKMLAMNGRNSQICGPISASCGAIPARSFCLWEASSGKAANGTMI